jgi:chemotaxis protein CheX
MDANIINPMIQATVDILEKVGALSMTVQKPFLKTDTRARGDVTSVIALEGDTPGTFSISFPGGCITAVVSKMLGEPITELNEDIKDALGEITNMISGQASQLFEMTGKGLKASLSQVIMGRDQPIPHASDVAILGIACTTDYGEVILEMCFEEEF